ncbi:MAG: hypothetical protein M1825_005203 [Sarcosagium campestre]|nr:MAG: hypothetical protein M1825_005203 [Sarcosagium campestre]
MGSYNIYTESEANEVCTKVTLVADGCFSNCPAPPKSVPAKPAPKTCPADLSGTYEFPHLIVPVNSAHPNQAYGTSFFGEVSHEVSSLFNFDVPSSYSGKTCSLVFLFPEQKDLVTSSYTFSGSGGVDFSKLSGTADTSTTYASAPSVATDYGVTTVAPGNSYTIATFHCPAGEAVGFKLSASGDTYLHYFQDYNPAP